MKCLELRFFGGLHIFLDGVPLNDLKSNKGRALLCYLAVTGKQHSRSALAGLLWVDMPEERARANLRKTLSRLKPYLGAYLFIDREIIAFNQDTDYQLDVADFEAGVQPGAEFKRMQAALSLFKGDFLEGYYLPDTPLFDEWTLMQRARFRGAALRALNTLAAHFTKQKDYNNAITYTRRLLEIEPWHEEAHRELMGLLAFAGQRSAALRQYEICGQILRDELGVEPTLATLTLYEQILRGQFSKPEFIDVRFTDESGRVAQVVQQRHPLGQRLHFLAKPLVGRLGELSHLKDLITNPDVRLVTILGPGGIGKTHLAMAIASEVAESHLFNDGVVFVPLDSATTLQQMVSTIAGQLGQSLGSTRDPEMSLLNLLRDKAYLLVLDNFEQLHSEADYLLQMLYASPMSKLLLTSRERLKLQEEWVLDLDGLPYPCSPHEAGAAETESVTLFVQRAQQLRSNFSLDRNLEHVVRICKSTQGMPLAIEQAASWIRTISTRDIARQIEENLDSLSTSLSNVPGRHRTLRSVFDGSWSWLSDIERDAFSRLSVFRGGFTVETAQHVANATLPVLSALVDKSLLQRSPQDEAATRFDMHDLLRTYAQERLEASGTSAVSQAWESHLEYFLSFAEKAESFWDTAHEGEWLKLLESERGNLHTAVQRAIDNDWSEQALRLNAALFTFWVYNSPAAEADAWIEATLKMHWDQLSAEAKRARAKALNVAGYAILRNSDFDKASRYFQEGLELYTELEDRRGVAWSLRGCGFLPLILNDLKVAHIYFERSLAICREIGDEWGEAWSIYDLGNTALAKCEFEQAKRILEDALECFLRQGVHFGAFRANISLGHVERGLRAWTQARLHYREALTIQQSTRFIQFVAQALEGLAHVAVASEDYKTGVKLLGAGQARRDSLEMGRWVHQERDYRSSMSLTQMRLDKDVWQREWDWGYGMMPHEAITFALKKSAPGIEIRYDV